MLNLKWLTFILTCLTLASCMADLSVQKRRYRPGFYVDRAGKVVSETKPEMRASAVDRIQFHESKIEITREGAGSLSSVSGSLSGIAPEQVGMHAKMPGQSRPVHLVLPDLPTRITTLPVIRIARPGASRGNWFLGGILFSGLLAGGYFSRKTEKLRSLSLWAKNNRRASRLILIFTHCLMGFGMFYMGYGSGRAGLYVSENSTVWAAAAFLLSALTYPFRNVRSGFFAAGGYLRRKWHDLILFVSGLLMVFSQGNFTASGKAAESAVGKVVTNVLLSAIPDGKIQAISTLEEAASDPDVPSERTPGEIIARIFFSILTTALLALIFMLTVGLSCNLSCSGNEAGAVFVMVAGAALMIFLGIVLFRKIWRRRPNEKHEKAPAG